MGRSDHVVLRRPSPCPHGARLELDDPAATFRPGDPIRGRLHLTGGDGPQPRSVAVELQIAALGEVSSIGVAATQALSPAALARDHTQVLAFSLVAPALPAPFAGTLFRAEPRLAAILDMPDAPPDLWFPQARAYPVVTLPVAIQPTSPSIVRVEHSTTRTIRAGISGFLLGVVALVVGLGLTALAIWLASMPGSLVAGGGGLMFVVAGGAISAMSFGNWRTARIIGAPALVIEAPRDPGGAIALHVAATVPRPGVDRGVVTVTVREHLARPQHDHSETAWDKEHVVATLRFELVRGAEGRWAVDIPTHALETLPSTLSLAGNRVHWMMNVSLFAGDREWKSFEMLEAFRGEPWRPAVTFWWV